MWVSASGETVSQHDKVTFLCLHGDSPRFWQLALASVEHSGMAGRDELERAIPIVEVRALVGTVLVAVSEPASAKAAERVPQTTPPRG